jgi:hypothetical protein
MSKRIQTDKVPAGYDLDMDVKDGMGRSWKFRTSPHRGGVVGYFTSLSELVTWGKQVKEIRDLQDGKQTFKEKVLSAMLTGDISMELGSKILLT